MESLVGQKPPAVPDHELISRIGSGSYGEVWLAKSATGVLRAVKIVHRDRFSDDRPYEREFAGLKLYEPISRSHEGLVDILQVGRNEQSGEFYYVMELGDGTNSQDGRFSPITLESRIREQGRLPVATCLQITTQLGEALRFLHEHKLTHRDVKPSNVIFVNGVPKLADVGLVSTMATARTFVGTEGFVPPEGPGTAQADIFALGKCLYEMAMGKDRQQFPSPPTWLGDTADPDQFRELNELINLACHPDRTRRYAHCDALLADLHRLQAGRSIRRRRVWMRRSRIAVAALFLCAALWIGVHFMRIPPQPITAAAISRPQPTGPELQIVMQRDAPPAFDSTGAHFGFYGNSRVPSLFFAQDHKFAVTDINGNLRGRKPWIGNKGDCFELVGLADIAPDRGQVRLLWTRDHTNLFVHVVNDSGFPQYSVEERGALDPSAKELPVELPASTIGFIKLFPSTGMLPSRLLFEARHGYGQMQSYLTMRRLGDAETLPLWRYPMAAPLFRSSLVDLDNDGREDLLFGTTSTGNHARLADGRDDEHSDLIALTQDGDQLLRATVGGVFSQVEPRFEQDRIIVRCSVPRSQNCLTDIPLRAGLYSFDREGRRLQQWECTHDVSSFLITRVQGRPVPVILTTDEHGNLAAHDWTNLEPFWTTNLVQRTHDWVKLDLIGAEDLDGDGTIEILLQSTQVQFLSGRGLGHHDDEARLRRGWQTSLHVLNDKLEPIASRILSPELPTEAPCVAQIIHPTPDGPPTIFYHHDRIVLLRLNGRP
jgi:serine/threonine protein kinase